MQTMVSKLPLYEIEDFKSQWNDISEETEASDENCLTVKKSRNYVCFRTEVTSIIWIMGFQLSRLLLLFVISLPNLC